MTTVCPDDRQRATSRWAANAEEGPAERVQQMISRESRTGYSVVHRLGPPLSVPLFCRRLRLLLVLYFEVEGRWCGRILGLVNDVSIG